MHSNYRSIRFFRTRKQKKFGSYEGSLLTIKEHPESDVDMDDGRREKMD